MTGWIREQATLLNKPYGEIQRILLIPTARGHKSLFSKWSAYKKTIPLSKPLQTPIQLYDYGAEPTTPYVRGIIDDEPEEEEYDEVESAQSGRVVWRKREAEDDRWYIPKEFQKPRGKSKTAADKKKKAFFKLLDAEKIDEYPVAPIVKQYRPMTTQEAYDNYALIGRLKRDEATLIDNREEMERDGMDREIMEFENRIANTKEKLRSLLEGREIGGAQGSGVKGKGLGLSIARKIYDWYKPPIDFEEWRARQQDRFSSDAEAEAALEEAKASRVLREAEQALIRLKVDTTEYKKKLLAIRNEKVKLAREIGVWVGDDRNPVDWDSARAETARREAERERIQREETDYDVIGEGLSGGALKAAELKALLKASYSGENKVGDFVLDKRLSTQTSKVYYNPSTQQTVVAHKGTQGLTDWMNNVAYAVGGRWLYEKTDRFKEAEKVQREAEKAYGTKNLSTIGHSQGALQSEILGQKGKEVITLNKPTNPLFDKSASSKQTDIRTERDIVSIFTDPDITIESESWNPLTEHSTDVLDRLNPERMIGEGLKMVNRQIHHFKRCIGMGVLLKTPQSPAYREYSSLIGRRNRMMKQMKRKF